MNNLEIFDTGLGYPTVKIEHVRLGIIVPYGGFVVQDHDVVDVLGFPSFEERFAVVMRFDTDPLSVRRHAWQNDGHLPWSLEAEHVRVLKLGYCILIL